MDRTLQSMEQGADTLASQTGVDADVFRNAGTSPEAMNRAFQAILDNQSSLPSDGNASLKIITRMADVNTTLTDDVKQQLQTNYVEYKNASQPTPAPAADDTGPSTLRQMWDNLWNSWNYGDDAPAPTEHNIPQEETIPNGASLAPDSEIKVAFAEGAAEQLAATEPLRAVEMFGPNAETATAAPDHLTVADNAPKPGHPNFTV